LSPRITCQWPHSNAQSIAQRNNHMQVSAQQCTVDCSAKQSHASVRTAMHSRLLSETITCKCLHINAQSIAQQEGPAQECTVDGNYVHWNAQSMETMCTGMHSDGRREPHDAVQLCTGMHSIALPCTATLKKYIRSREKSAKILSLFSAPHLSSSSEIPQLSTFISRKLL
jgi:hypothetical protein